MAWSSVAVFITKLVLVGTRGGSCKVQASVFPPRTSYIILLRFPIPVTRPP